MLTNGGWKKKNKQVIYRETGEMIAYFPFSSHLSIKIHTL